MRIESNIRSLGAVTVLGFLLLAGCGGGGNGNGSQPLDAWELLETNEYEEAITAFREALDVNPDSTDACNGLGWAYALDGQLDSAKAYFQIAIDHDADQAAYHAGLSAVLKAQGDLAGAITHGLSALTIDSLWVFEHNSSIDYKDVRLILAQAYFGQGPDSYADAQTQVDKLEPDNGLDPNDPATWGIHPTYAAALLKEIQEIEEWVGVEMIL